MVCFLTAFMHQELVVYIVKLEEEKIYWEYCNIITIGIFCPVRLSTFCVNSWGKKKKRRKFSRKKKKKVIWCYIATKKDVYGSNKMNCICWIWTLKSTDVLPGTPLYEWLCCFFPEKDILVICRVSTWISWISIQVS